MNKTLFLLGGTGFIGHEGVIQAVQAGWHVKALVRSEEGENLLQQAGAHPVVGDISRPETWIAEARGSTTLIDLTQPKFPKRLSRCAMKALSAERQAMTRATLEALQRNEPLAARACDRCGSRAGPSRWPPTFGIGRLHFLRYGRS